MHACMKLKLDEKMKGSPQFRLLLAFLTSRMADVDIDGILDKDADQPPDYPGKSAVDMVADYLTDLRKVAWSQLERTYGASLFQSMRKDLVVTVPAVWSERAKDLTLKAVEKAGFKADKMSMVTEPEAAAIYTLKGDAGGPEQGRDQGGRRIRPVRRRRRHRRPDFVQGHPGPAGLPDRGGSHRKRRQVRSLVRRKGW